MIAPWIVAAAVMSAAVPASAPEHAALAQRLARTAEAMVPDSMQAAAGPECAPYRLYTYRDAGTGRARGAAVAATGEVVLAGDEAGLARMLRTAAVAEKQGAPGALDIVRVLFQSAPILDAAAIAALPVDDRGAVHPPKAEKAGGAWRATGFVRQGEELFRVALNATADRAEVTFTSNDEVLGRDDVDQAVRALRSPDEVVRAAAAFELSGYRDARAVAALDSALADAAAPVRSAAAEALGRQCAKDAALAPKAGAALKRALAAERDAGARDAMKRTLEALPPQAGSGAREAAKPAATH